MKPWRVVIRICFLLLALTCFRQQANGQSITLTVDNMDDGIAKLQWNSPNPGNLLTYTIYRKIGLAPMISLTTISTVDNPVIFYDTTFVCDTTIAYFVTAGTFSSDTIKKNIYNEKNPQTVYIDSVSYDLTTRQLIIGWQKCYSFDAIGYDLFEGDNVSTVYVDIQGTNQTSYTSPALLFGESYRVASKDTCGNYAQEFSSKKQSFAAHVSDDKCADSIRISWDNHKQMLDHIGSYEIFVSQGGAPFVSMGKVDSTRFNYAVPFTSGDSLYVVYVRAYNQDASMSATSIPDTLRVEPPTMPAYFYLRNVSVLNNQHVEVKLYTDTANPFKECRIYAQYPNASSPTLMKTIPYNQMQNNLVWVDNTSEQNNGSIQYWAELIDTSYCEKKIAQTNIGVTIFLSAQKTDDKVLLSWNSYEHWDGGVDGTMTIYRILNETDTTIITVNVADLSYEDDIPGSSHIVSLTYVVKQKENPNKYGFQEQSYSNKVYVILSETVPIYMPTGFNPHGISPVYKPIFIPLPGDQYEFYILNRMGNVIFHSKDPDAGWDGTYQGAYVPVGVYVYLVKVIREGTENIKKGTVTVIK